MTITVRVGGVHLDIVFGSLGAVTSEFPDDPMIETATKILRDWLPGEWLEWLGHNGDYGLAVELRKEYPMFKIVDDPAEREPSAKGENYNYNPHQERWPKGTPSGIGGQWKPKLGSAISIGFSDKTVGTVGDTAESYEGPYEIKIKRKKDQQFHFLAKYARGTTGIEQLKDDISTGFILDMAFSGEVIDVSDTGFKRLLASTNDKFEDGSAYNLKDKFGDVRMQVPENAIEWVKKLAPKLQEQSPKSKAYDPDTNTMSMEMADLFSISKRYDDWLESGDQMGMYLDIKTNTFRLNQDSTVPRHSYSLMNDWIGTWAKSSNNENLSSLHTQKVAAEMMGSKLSPWQQERYDMVTRHRKRGGPSLMNERTKLPFEASFAHADEYASTPAIMNTPEHADQMTAFAVKYTYDRTQQWFKDRGYEPDDTLRVWRGFSVPEDSPVGKVLAEEGLYTKARFTQNPLESWSIEPDTAENFASSFGGEITNPIGSVVAMDIPISRIFSHAHTGYGCYDEGELVIMSADSLVDQAIVVKVFTDKSSMNYQNDDYQGMPDHE